MNRLRLACTHCTFALRIACAVAALAALALLAPFDWRGRLGRVSAGGGGRGAGR